MKKCTNVGAGFIDADYRGELGVILFNFGDNNSEVNMGDKIAQLICEKTKTSEIVKVGSLGDTGWGRKRYSSNGINSEESQSIQDVKSKKNSELFG